MEIETEFNKEQFILFKQAYEEAVRLKHRIFIFNGQELLTGYAKYMIEYLDPIFNKQTKKND